MIQRIQTVFLFIVVLSSISLCFLTEDIILFRWDKSSLTLAIISGVLGIISIFKYKKRKQQILFNNLNLIVNLLLMGAFLYWLLTLSGGFSFPEKGIWLIFPAVSILNLFLANIYIKRDDRLVKSVDRLR